MTDNNFIFDSDENTHNLIINGIEYTVVETYEDDSGKIIQLDSDEDTILRYLDKNGVISELPLQMETEFRKQHYLIKHEYVFVTINDLVDKVRNNKRQNIDENTEIQIKAFFKNKLAQISPLLAEIPYINERLQKIRYRLTDGRNNFYDCNNGVYCGYYNEANIWAIIHETVHAVVDKSFLTTYGLIEGITDNMVGKLLPEGNYHHNITLHNKNSNYLLMQINDVGTGQRHMVPFAKQLEYALGSNYNFYEMFAFPHKQIQKFGQMYGRTRCRILNHKINKLYYKRTFEDYMQAQQYMLETIFDKKEQMVINEETAKRYFEELINFGMLRARINGKDEALKKYYEEKKDLIHKRGIDISLVPDYYEKSFYPNGDCYTEFPNFLQLCYKLKRDGKINHFQILYNQDHSCVYIIYDNKLNYIQNCSFDNNRFYSGSDIDQTKCEIIPLCNGKYLITGPDGITEETLDTNAEYLANDYSGEEKGISRI